MDRTVRLWDLDRGEEVRVLTHPTGVHCVAFTPDGRRALSGSGFRQEPRGLASAGSDSRVRLWDLQTGEELAHHDGAPHGVTALAVAGDGRTVLVGTEFELRVLELPK
jgi:WD40 repeat protein